MRKPIAVILSLLLAGVAWLAQANAGPALPSPIYPPVSVQVEAVRLGAHSYYVPGLSGAASPQNEGFMSNAGFVVTPAGVVVFDTLGTPSLAQAMVERIRQVTALPIRRVIVSHYHADHYYGAQVFKDLGAEIWAHRHGQGAMHTEAARERFAQRQEVLKPWVTQALQRFVEPDLWLEGDTDFELGGVHFRLRHVGPAHSAEDLAMHVVQDGVLYAGDLVFKGRVPFVGDADSRLWLAALDKLIALRPVVLVPGHGGASEDPIGDLILTRDYLNYLRQEMGKAVADLTPFEDAYAATDWSRYQDLPAFAEANRVNAYNTYLLMEKEAFGR
ncbi:MAG: MBL fold metallo-hydrolase [Thiobacillaceae bacterium]|jgi:glyoxylase-like metal-dependent hydrolase (beta-lactamase superfamily II)|nr:MBL fold metallo-hydrolase [Thiobacillaceae bacterium]